MLHIIRAIIEPIISKNLIENTLGAIYYQIKRLGEIDKKL